MALESNIQTKFGFEVPNVYIRVEGLRLPSKDEIKFQARFYAGIENPHFDDREYGCEYSLDGENPIKQAYEYLKTLPEFADATDV